MKHHLAESLFCLSSSCVIPTLAFTLTIPPTTSIMSRSSIRVPWEMRIDQTRPSITDTNFSRTRTQYSVNNRRRCFQLGTLLRLSPQENTQTQQAEPGSEVEELPANGIAVADGSPLESLEDGLPSSTTPSVDTGIGWYLLGAVLVGQLIFAGAFYGVATPSIRQEVQSSIVWSIPDGGLGVFGGLTLVLIGAALDTRDWNWVKQLDKITQELTLQLFGSKRRLGKVAALAIPLGAFVGLIEECTFRGFLPLMLSANTGLEGAAVVIISALIFGALHAATLAYFISATIGGLFFHGLFLATGNLAVPVVAHGLYDTLAFVKYHMKVTASEQTSN